MLTVCREPADGCRLNRCTRVLDARVADTDMVELVYETSSRQRPRDAAPPRHRRYNRFPDFPHFTHTFRLLSYTDGEYKPASIDDGHSDNVVITRREVALGIAIQRKYGRQQVRRTTLTFRVPHVPYLSSIIGGWWTRPSNWKANTAIVFAGILAVSYGVWTVSADREVSSPGFYPTSVLVKLWTCVSIATMSQYVLSLLCGYVHVQHALHRSSL